MIFFNVPPYVGCESKYIDDAIRMRKLSGDGEFTGRSSEWLEENIGVAKALLTTSCTHALEMAALLCDIQPGDEVIMPSFTFVSTANAFVLRGAKVVFVDIRPDTMNIDEALIEAAVTERTRAIVPVHYAGVSCEMDVINAIARKYNLLVVEDAAQAIMSSYNGVFCGTLGDFGCLSFHETKNVSCGEGGALLIRSDEHIARAEIIREKGTNRSKFFRGEVDKYSWCDIGSSYLPSELNAAYLFGQLENIDLINRNRLDAWLFYYDNLCSLRDDGLIEIACIPDNCVHNAHMFWVKVKDLEERSVFLKFLRDQGVYAVFHYVPLHSSDAGLQFGRFCGDDVFTTRESERIVRLPLYYDIEQRDCEKVVDAVHKFFRDYTGE
jgi:dTDP-4-amino-4,6-dideoxygalactose transaminase